MISRDLLYAIFQGLPHQYLNHLPAPWPRLAGLISTKSLFTPDPAEALRAAFASLRPEELRCLRGHFRNAYQVSQIPGLSPRQREALWTLRILGPVSLTRLSQVLSRDRGNLHHNLSELIGKGLLLKLLLPGGQHYCPVDQPLDSAACKAIDDFMDELMEQAEQHTALLLQPHAPHIPQPSWTNSITKTTKITHSTKPQQPQIAFSATLPRE